MVLHSLTGIDVPVLQVHEPTVRMTRAAASFWVNRGKAGYFHVLCYHFK